ncbi:general substrate transporter, partial [Aureobasidium melanogenum]
MTDLQPREQDVETVECLGSTVEVNNEIANNALLETHAQKNMTIVQAVRKYPKAIFFSALMSLCIVMEGYDTALIGNFYGFSPFNRKFGVPVNDGTGQYQVPSDWQSGFQNAAAGGQLIGLLLAGLFIDRFGYIKAIIGAQVLTISFIFLMFFAQNRSMLLAGYLLCGIPWGAFQASVTTYAADVTPMRLRPILTTFVNMCWVIGQFLSVGVLRGVIDRDDQWAWRIPYAVQWAWPPIIIAGMLFAPESPAWLVKTDQVERARNSLLRLSSGHVNEVEQTLALLVHTNALEQSMEMASESVSYLDCFRGSNLRRTEATCGAWLAQVLVGIWFGSNIIYFLQRGGLDENVSFNFGLGQQALALICTSASWFVMTHFGRRTIYLFGQAVMLISLLVVGFLGIPKSSSTISWISGAFLIIFVIAYQTTVGPVCYCLVTELPSARLRIKTVVLARIAYNLAALGANFLNPPILNPLAWNLRGKGAFVWVGFCALTFVWSFFRLPETKRAFSC